MQDLEVAPGTKGVESLSIADFANARFPGSRAPDVLAIVQPCGFRSRGRASTAPRAASDRSGASWLRGTGEVLVSRLCVLGGDALSAAAMPAQATPRTAHLPSES